VCQWAGRGAHIGITARGQRYTSVGLPGTGLSWPYGNIFYLKLSMHESLLDDQAEIVNHYAAAHPDTFPQESTIDQYFGPDRFKAYRALGYVIARKRLAIRV